jgi:hypothetical protein
MVVTVNNETNPIDIGTKILLKSLIKEYLIEITTINIDKPGEGKPWKYLLSL